MNDLWLSLKIFNNTISIGEKKKLYTWFSIFRWASGTARTENMSTEKRKNESFSENMDSIFGIYIPAKRSSLWINQKKKQQWCEQCKLKKTLYKINMN